MILSILAAVFYISAVSIGFHRLFQKRLPFVFCIAGCVILSLSAGFDQWMFWYIGCILFLIAPMIMTHTKSRLYRFVSFLLLITLFLLADAFAAGVMTSIASLSAGYGELSTSGTYAHLAGSAAFLLLSSAFSKRHADVMDQIEAESGKDRIRLFALYSVILAADLFLISVMYDTTHKLILVLFNTLLSLSLIVCDRQLISSILERNKESRLLADEAALKAVNRKVYENHLEIRRMKHDMNHQLTALLGYLTHHDYKQAQSLLEQMISSYEAVDPVIYTGEPAVDFLLSEKLSQLRKNGIRTKVTVNIKRVGINTDDFSILLGNLLENASEHISGENKEVVFSMVQKEELLFIHVSNTISQSVLAANSSLETEKPDTGAHGFGISSIRRIAAQYGGHAEFYEQNELFCADVLMNAN
jgi:sensor histidine kinase regulating citrate/malate metabolism